MRQEFFAHADAGVADEQDDGCQYSDNRISHNLGLRAVIPAGLIRFAVTFFLYQIFHIFRGKSMLILFAGKYEKGGTKSAFFVFYG